MKRTGKNLSLETLGCLSFSPNGSLAEPAIPPNTAEKAIRHSAAVRDDPWWWLGNGSHLVLGGGIGSEMHFAKVGLWVLVVVVYSGNLLGRLEELGTLVNFTMKAFDGLCGTV